MAERIIIGCGFNDYYYYLRVRGSVDVVRNCGTYHAVRSIVRADESGIWLAGLLPSHREGRPYGRANDEY